MLFLANWDQPAWGVQTPSAGPRNSLTTVTRQSCPGNSAGGMYKELPSVLKSVGVSKMECPRILSLLSLIMFIYNELYLSRSFWSDSIAGPHLGTLRRNLPFSIVKSFWEHYILEFVGGVFIIIIPGVHLKIRNYRINMASEFVICKNPRGIVQNGGPKHC